MMEQEQDLHGSFANLSWSLYRHRLLSRYDLWYSRLPTVSGQGNRRLLHPHRLVLPGYDSHLLQLRIRWNLELCYRRRIRSLLPGQRSPGL